MGCPTRRRHRTDFGQDRPPVTGRHEDHAIELNLLEIGDYIAEHDLGKFDVIGTIRRFDVEHQTDFLITLHAAAMLPLASVHCTAQR